MTRLRETDINHIAGRLDAYDRHLRSTTGASLRQIACLGAGVEESLLSELLRSVSFAAVPVSSGGGKTLPEAAIAQFPVPAHEYLFVAPPKKAIRQQGGIFPGGGVQNGAVFDRLVTRKAQEFWFTGE